MYYITRGHNIITRVIITVLLMFKKISRDEEDIKRSKVNLKDENYSVRDKKEKRKPTRRD